MRTTRTKQELTAETQRHGDRRGEDIRTKARLEGAEEAENAERTRQVPTGFVALVLVALSCWPASAAVVDRVAVVVGKIVITESEVQQEVRLTEFLNNEPLDLGPQQRRDAAERLVDQQLIRNEMEIGRYPEPSPGEARAVLLKFRQEHYASVNDFQAALKKYGITEEQLQQHLNWQLAAIHFTDLRFRTETPAPANGTGGKTAGVTGGADRADSNSKGAPPAGAQTGAGMEPGTVDQQMDAWLKEARSQVRIQFKKEAFQ
jgi:hypothetical protein